MRKFASVLALLLTGVLFVLLPLTVSKQQKSDSSPAPIRYLRVWLCSDAGGAWVKKQAALYERENAGTRIYLRIVTENEWEKEDAVAPDLLLFMQETSVDTARLRALSGTYPQSASALASGLSQGVQLAVPLFCERCRMVYFDAHATPAAPTSRFFYSPPPAVTPSPSPKSTAPLSPVAVAESARRAANYLPKGTDYTVLPDEQAKSAFLSGEYPAALLPEKMLPEGAYAYEDLPVLVSDRVLWGSVFHGADAQAEAFLLFLSAQKAQSALEGYHFASCIAETDLPKSLMK